MEKGPSLKMKNRLNRVILIAVVVSFLFLILRIGNISIVKGDFYQSKASAQQLRDITINPNRGTIYDKNMKILAQSATVWTVFLSPNDVKEDEHKKKIASGLSPILKVEEDKIIEKLGKKNYYEVLKKQVEKPEADQVREFVKNENIAGVHLVEDTKRYYPYSNFASNVIGFTGSDNQGLYGIEAYYDKYLKGISGRIVSAKNAKGTDMPFNYEKFYEPKDGNNVVLTIDQTIQHFVEKALDETIETHKVKNRAAAIAMDVNTGAILGMSTKPDFNLNDPFTIQDNELLKSLEGLEGPALSDKMVDARERQWKNKAITEIYEPGSVFKVVTGSAALEENKSIIDQHYNCPGYTVVSGTKMKCWKTSGHGNIDFTQAFVFSCNPALVDMGAAVGATKFYQYFREFGLTEKTGVDLPGEENSVYVKESQYGPVQLASASFGQSNKITPIQMITAMAAVVNGGKLVKPYVVEKIVDSDNNTVKSFETVVKRQVISKETSEKMKVILEEAVSGNSGSNAYIKGYRIGGKSGTSEKLDGDKNARVASFSGFAPANDPKIIVLVMVDEPSAGHVFGNVVAAPVVTSILSDILPYLGVGPQFTNEELAQMEVIVPNIIGQGVSVARNKLSSQGFKVRVVGSGDKVLKQNPPSGVSAPKDSTIIIYTEESSSNEQVLVPNLIGMTPSQANKELANLGLNIQITGGSVQHESAKVVSQSIGAGTNVNKGTVISVQVLNVDQLG